MRLTRNIDGERILATSAMSLQSRLIGDVPCDAPRDTPCIGAAALAAVPAEPWTPSVYMPSRSGPFALGSSVAVVAGLVAALATISAISAKPAKKPNAMINVVNLQPPPPPPAAPKHVTPPPVMPRLFAPPPIVQLPIVPVQLAMSDTPPPVVEPVMTSSAKPAESAPVVSAGQSVDGGDLSARMIDAAPPVYPEECRRRREQGIVTLAVELNAEGRVAVVSVAASSGFYRLDRAALGAVRRWRWSPMTRNGQSMIVRGFVTLPFVLRGA
jgi:protein TonB